MRIERMLIGAHVSQAGGLDKAVAARRRAGLRGDPDLQPVPADVAAHGLRRGRFAAFRAALRETPIKAVLIHAVYLLNCASEDREIRQKSLASLIQSLRVGDGIGAAGVVLHPGSAKQGDVAKAISAGRKGDPRGARRVRGLPASPRGHGGRRRDPRALVRGAGRGSSRPPEAMSGSASAWTPVTSTPPATTSRPPTGLRDTLDRMRRRRRAASGCTRCTSTTRWSRSGSNRDRHALLGEGELGEEGCAVVPVRAALRAPALRARDGPRRRGAGRRGRGQGQAAAHAGQARRGPRRASQLGCPAMSEAQVPAGGRRPGGLRDHRRSGQEDDLPLALPARGARAAPCPGDRGGGR